MNMKQLTIPNFLDSQSFYNLKKFIQRFGGSSINGRAHGTSTQSISAGTDTKVSLGVKDFANGITYDTTNHKFTIITAGQYIVTGTCFFSSITNSGKAVIAKLFKNGSVIAESGFGSVASGNLAAPQVTDIQNCIAGDFFELFVFQNDTGSNSLALALSYLAIAKV